MKYEPGTTTFYLTLTIFDTTCLTLLIIMIAQVLELYALLRWNEKYMCSQTKSQPHVTFFILAPAVADTAGAAVAGSAGSVGSAAAVEVDSAAGD